MHILVEFPPKHNVGVFLMHKTSLNKMKKDNTTNCRNQPFGNGTNQDAWSRELLYNFKALHGGDNWAVYLVDKHYSTATILKKNLINNRTLSPNHKAVC